VNKNLLRSYRFHHEYGGYIVGQSAICALRAARAELLLDEARAAGVASIDWNIDDEPYEHGCFSDEEIAAKFDSNEWTGPFWASLYIHDNVEASLAGIVVGPKGTDDPYCRVIEAELALEVEDDLRQALGDHYDGLGDWNDALSEQRRDGQYDPR